MLNGENIFSRFISQKSAILGHWIIQVGAVCLSLAGFIIVVVNKNNSNKLHFQTWHAIFGLVSFIFMCITFVVGIPALFNVELRKYIPPRINKFVHILCGSLAYIFGSVTLVLSLYSGWFVRKTNETQQVICFIALVIIMIWTLLKPVINIVKRSRNLI